MLLKRLENVAFVVALQEALISLAPLIVLSSMALLLSQFFVHFDLDFGPFEQARLVSLAEMLQQFAALGVVVSVAYHFSMRYDTERILSILLSLSTYAGVVAVASDFPHRVPSLPRNIDFLQIAVPILSVLLFRLVVRYANLTISIATGHQLVVRIFEHIYSFAITFILVLVVYVAARQGYQLVADHLQALFSGLPDDFLLGTRALISQGLWFVGIHGPRMANAIMGTEFLDDHLFPGLTLVQFYRLFAVSGGSGMGLSLVIALFLAARQNRHMRQVAQLSAPFVVFNINTLVIYGLPIVLNRYLLLPFLLVPLLNLVIAGAVLSVVPVQFVTEQVAWTTPPVLDGYLVSGGNPWVMGLQVGLMAVSVLIYLPFVKRYARSQDSAHHLQNLAGNLGIVSSLKSREGLKTFQAQHSLIESNYRLGRIIRALNREHLMVHYQPQVDLHTGRCASVEALLRIRLENGQLTGPFFLEDIEKAGIAAVVDLWVCEQVLKDLKKWADEDIHMPVSINLHPDTLQDSPMIETISSLMRGWPVEFEIIERALVTEEARSNLRRLRQAGFRIAIDDFGDGYFSYRLIHGCNIDTIKIDRSLVAMLDEEGGRVICEHAIHLCQALRFKCVVEGVETARQLELLREMGARYLQGFYFAGAMPAEEASRFIPDLEQEDGDTVKHIGQGTEQGSGTGRS